MDHFAIILEWENALAHELDRPSEMLRQLGTQARDYARLRDARIDLLVVFNSELVDKGIPQNCVSEQIREWPGDIEFLNVPGRHYYELKNAGAEHTDADAFIFIDSDVVPQPDWMQTLLDAVQAPGATLVAGNAFIGGESLTDRIFAAFWIFSPRKEFEGIKIASNFWANNVAFKTKFFLSNPFPAEDSYRGQCAALARSLDRRIPRHGKAWVDHPAPNGVSHILQRALGKGYDQVYWSRRLTNQDIGIQGDLKKFFQNSKDVISKVNRRKKSLKLSRFEIFSSYIAGISYFSFVLIGSLVTHVWPNLIRRRIPSI